MNSNDATPWHAPNCDVLAPVVKPMKVLSLTQPWATLMLIGAKRVETRSWRTHHRGKIAIHAAAGFPRYAREFAEEPVIQELLNGAELPLGVILGTTTIVDVRPTEDAIHLVSETEAILGNYEPGRYAWFTEGMTPLPEPVAAKGALGLWNWGLPSPGARIDTIELGGLFAVGGME